jgi:hypothetical protein
MREETKLFRDLVYAQPWLPPHRMGPATACTEDGTEYSHLRANLPSEWMEHFRYRCAAHPGMNIVWRIEPEHETFGRGSGMCYGRFAFEAPKVESAA